MYWGRVFRSDDAMAHTHTETPKWEDSDDGRRNKSESEPATVWRARFETCALCNLMDWCDRDAMGFFYFFEFPEI